MPYITEKNRIELDHQHRMPNSVGEYNYMMSKRLNWLLKRDGLRYSTLTRLMDKLDQWRRAPSTYQVRADTSHHEMIRSAARDAQLEFYRRIVVPYENKMIKKNGDVYEKEIIDRLT